MSDSMYSVDNFPHPPDGRMLLEWPCRKRGGDPMEPYLLFPVMVTARPNNSPLGHTLVIWVMSPEGDLMAYHPGQLDFSPTHLGIWKRR